MSLTLEDQKRIFQTIEKYPGEDYYVYALCDGKNVPFYIGKGKAGRVLQHLKEAKAKSIEEALQMADDESNGIRQAQENSEKIARINAVGDALQHVIIKWGLTQHEAFMCESALINLLEFSKDAVIEKLTNKVDGHASEAEKESPAEDKTKARTLEQFRDEVAIETKDISEIPANVVFIKINTLYPICRCKDLQKELKNVKEAARAMWGIGQYRRPHIQYIFALYQQRVVGIFNVKRISDSVADEWKENELRDFPDFPPDARKMDRWKAQFSSFAEAKKALTPDEYEIFKAQIEKECSDSKAKQKPTPEKRLKDEQSKVFFILGEDVPAEIISFYNCRLENKDDPDYFTGRISIKYNFKPQKSPKKDKKRTEVKQPTGAIRKAGSGNWNKLIERKSFCDKLWTLADNGKSIYSYLPGNRYLTFKILQTSDDNSVKIEFGILSEYQKEDEKQRHIDKIEELKNELARFINGKVLSYDNDSFVKGSDKNNTYFVLKPSESGSSNKSVSIEDVEEKVSAFEERLTNCGLKAKLLELCK